MITFLVSIAILVAGYFLYGTYLEKKFGANKARETPANAKRDGIDFVPMKIGRVFLIQFLNIAGLGPIFGAIAGALWGPVAFLWIVFGSIFAGSVHDYFSGMMSMRHDGDSISEIVSRYLGVGMKHFMRFFSVLLLILVGVVFVKGPATILENLTGVSVTTLSIAIFIYYLLATMIPIDKLIGKIYPIFGLSLLVMAVGIFVVLIVGEYKIPELTIERFSNMHASADTNPVFPLLFVTIACGAISGFHSTQSPMMARCIGCETDGKKVFVGAMITEGIVALIWAAASMSFFGGVRELGENMAIEGHNAAWMVNIVCNTMLGKIGGILAIFGVVAAPITSGDTAFRSVRLTIADIFKVRQTKIMSRLWITIPIFLIALVLIQIDFAIIWRYFGWSNQVLATVVLWTIVVYIKKEGKSMWFALVPAAFMTTVVISYILASPIGFNLTYKTSYIVGVLITLGLSLWSILTTDHKKRKLVTA